MLEFREKNKCSVRLLDSLAIWTPKNLLRYCTGKHAEMTLKSEKCHMHFPVRACEKQELKEKKRGRKTETKQSAGIYYPHNWVKLYMNFAFKYTTKEEIISPIY